MFTLTQKKSLLRLDELCPQRLWPIPHLWPPVMNFIHEEQFLRCKWAKAEQATDIMSSMQCSPFLSAWPTSAPEIEALRSLLPILFCYFIAPATALETGGEKEESMAQERGAQGSHEPFLYCFSSSTYNWTSESTEQSFVWTVIMTDSLRLTVFLL